jgi:ATP-dependent Clp protease protease subunit
VGGKKSKEENTSEEVETQEEVEQVEEQPEQPEEDQHGPPIIVIPPMLGMESKPEIRVIGLIGDVEEEKASEVIYGFLALKESGKKPVDPEDPSKGVTYEPIKLICSTYGGSASDMFAIYDMMRMVKEDCEIETLGIGKVMSAGVLLLAAGTKGKRKIGKHCRVMLHAVSGGAAGALHSMENEMDEIRWIQDQYINALAEETDLSKKMLKKILDKKINTYLDAKQAVEYGIADEIV